MRELGLLFWLLFVVGCIPKQAAVDEEIVASAAHKEESSIKDRSEWRQVLQWSHDCEDAFQMSYAGAQSGIEEVRFSDGRALLSVLCSAGSYQPSFVFFVMSDHEEVANVEPLSFTFYESMDGETLEASEQSELWGETLFDPESGVLNVLHVGRQAGDCGSWATYDLKGKDAELLEGWARYPCPAMMEESADLKLGVPPEGWVRIDLE